MSMFIINKTIEAVKGSGLFLRSDKDNTLQTRLGFSGKGLPFETLSVAATSIRTAGISAEASFNLESMGFVFESDKTQLLSAVLELPQRYAEDTDIIPYLTWHSRKDIAGKVRWAIDYRWNNTGDSIKGDITTITAIQETKKGELVKTVFPTISGKGKKRGSVLSLKIYRTGSSGGDNLKSDAIVKIIGIKYAANSLGSYRA